MTKTEVVVPFSTLAKIIATAVGGVILVKICPLLLLLCLAMLIAVSLHPVSKWMTRLGIPHGLAVALIAVLILLALFAAVFFLIPNLAEQLGTVAQEAPGWGTEILGKIPPGYLKSWLMKQADHASVSSEHMLAASGWLATSISEFFLVLILAIYLIYDGERAYQWTRAFFSATNRRKLDDTAKEVSSIIVAYVAGQFITSTICGVFVFIVLISLHVPAALLLAALAMIFDILPLLGFFIFTIPAILLAMTTSASAAITVGILYLAYHCLLYTSPSPRD